MTDPTAPKVRDTPIDHSFDDKHLPDAKGVKSVIVPGPLVFDGSVVKTPSTSLTPDDVRRAARKDGDVDG